MKIILLLYTLCLNLNDVSKTFQLIFSASCISSLLGTPNVIPEIVKITKNRLSHNNNKIPLVWFLCQNFFPWNTICCVRFFFHFVFIWKCLFCRTSSFFGRYVWAALFMCMLMAFLLQTYWTMSEYLQYRTIIEMQLQFEAGKLINIYLSKIIYFQLHFPLQQFAIWMLSNIASSRSMKKLKRV